MKSIKIHEGENNMPVFDFSNEPEEKDDAQCTYTVVRSSAPQASPQKPLLLLDNRGRKSGSITPAASCQPHPADSL